MTLFVHFFYTYPVPKEGLLTIAYLPVFNLTYHWPTIYDYMKALNYNHFNIVLDELSHFIK